MSISRYILKTVWHYRRLNLTLVLGIALSAAILTGALIVGDSVRYSLQQITIERLGRTTQVVTAGERIFRKQLATDLARVSGERTAALLRANGVAVVDGGQLRVNQLAVWGVDSLFLNFAEADLGWVPAVGEAAINEQLAKLARVKVGDEILLRVNKLSAFPANTPFVAADGSGVSFRVRISRILSAPELGNFNLQNNQTAPRNVFLNAEWLNNQLGLDAKANVVLLDGNSTSGEINKMLQTCWSTDDANLRIRENQDLNYTEVVSDRVFIEPELEKYVLSSFSGSWPVMSYFANEFRFGDQACPYSFVSTDTLLSGNQMVVNQWLADDLKVNVGDSVRVSYFEVGPLRRLKQRDTVFVVQRIEPIKGLYADQNLMPDIPGLSDAGHCSDWETGVPVDLSKIRPTDEAYWNHYKGTPKAFVSLAVAQKLWGNRFGQATAIRFPGLRGKELSEKLMASMNPEMVGFQVTDVRQNGLDAASHSVDFGQLFIGLSFFVLFAAVLLSFLLFKLFLNYRQAESATLLAMGFTPKQVRNMLVKESLVYVLLGVLLGMPFAIGYNKLILSAINTIWTSIVQTSIVHINIQFSSLLIGAFSIVFISILTVWIVLNKFLKQQKIVLQKSFVPEGKRTGKWQAITGILLAAGSVVLLLVNGLGSDEINPDLFFMSGFGLLPGFLFLLDSVLRKLARHSATMAFSSKSFFLKRVAGERRRNVMTAAFLSVGVFLVVSTGLYRKDLTRNAGLPSSGTGGYPWFIETTLPVLFDLNTPEGRNETGLPDSVHVVQFSVQPGDDASCLNLNRISRPRLIGFNPDDFDRRQAFTFATRSVDLDAEHPWQSLSKELSDGVIPGIADQTVIQWGLGKKVGDTLVYKNEQGDDLKIKLIGGLANSVFQGNVLIDARFFNQNFPSVSGSGLFLADAPETISAEELAESLRNYGPEVVRSTDRLLSFYQVENTYLNIFLMLGALGLLIGTIGLGVLIFRTTFEQVPQFALLQSVGFSKTKIYRLVVGEKLLVVAVAVLIGLIPAFLSGLPTLFSPLYAGLWNWLWVIPLLVILSGAICTLVAVWSALQKDLVGTLRNE